MVLYVIAMCNDYIGIIQLFFKWWRKGRVSDDGRLEVKDKESVICYFNFAYSRNPIESSQKKKKRELEVLYKGINIKGTIKTKSPNFLKCQKTKK